MGYDDEYRTSAVGWSDDYNTLVHFLRRRVQPPSLVYVTLNDIVQLRVWSPTAVSTVNLSIRMLDPANQVVPTFETVTVQPNGSVPQLLNVSNVEGFLLSASIECPGSRQGQCYVTLELARGQGSSDQTFGQVLIAGYPGQFFRIGYPQSPAKSPLDGNGAMRPIVGTTPAAGADVVDVVPAGRLWILQAVRLLFTAAAAVANRSVSLAIDDGAGHVMAQAADSTLIVATQVVSICFAPGLTSPGAPLQHNVGWVEQCRLLPGWRITTSTANIQVGDAITIPVYMVQEYVSG